MESGGFSQPDPTFDERKQSGTEEYGRLTSSIDMNLIN